MQGWIALGNEIYAADQARDGFVKMGPYAFEGPVIPTEDGAYGGSGLRFEGMNGAGVAEAGMTEGWLSFVDGGFPEIKLTTVLQAKAGSARMRHVVTGDADVSIVPGGGMTLAALLLETVPRLYTWERGAFRPLEQAEGSLKSAAVAVENPAGVIILSGGDGFAVSSDEAGFCLAVTQQVDTVISLDDPFTTDWIRIATGKTLDEARTEAPWLAEL